MIDHVRRYTNKALAVINPKSKGTRQERITSHPGLVHQGYTNKLGFTLLVLPGFNSPRRLAIIFDNQVVLGCLQESNLFSALSALIVCVPNEFLCCKNYRTKYLVGTSLLQENFLLRWVHCQYKCFIHTCTLSMLTNVFSCQIGSYQNRCLATEITSLLWSCASRTVCIQKSLIYEIDGSEESPCSPGSMVCPDG